MTLAARISQAGEQRSARVESLRALAALAVVWGHVVAASLALNPALRRPVISRWWSGSPTGAATACSFSSR